MAKSGAESGADSEAESETALDVALLDMLAGWAEYLEACAEMADLPREAFEAEYFGDEPVEPEVYDQWRAHYTPDYLRSVEQLHEAAETLVLDFAGEGGAMTPAEFVANELLPLFRYPGEIDDGESG